MSCNVHVVNFEPVIVQATPLRVGHARSCSLSYVHTCYHGGDVLTPLEHRYYWTIDIYSYDKEQSTSPLALLEARCPIKLASRTRGTHASHSTMHLHDHHVCAHSPTALTNPEHSELVTECIFHALQARTTGR